MTWRTSSEEYGDINSVSTLTSLDLHLPTATGSPHRKLRSFSSKYSPTTREDRWTQHACRSSPKASHCIPILRIRRFLQSDRRYPWSLKGHHSCFSESSDRITEHTVFQTPFFQKLKMQMSSWLITNDKEELTRETEFWLPLFFRNARFLSDNPLVLILYSNRLWTCTSLHSTHISCKVFGEFH